MANDKANYYSAMSRRDFIKTLGIGGLSISLIGLITGCSKSKDSVKTYASEQTIRPEGWTDKTHSKNVDPNYKIVFPEDKVNEIKITIAPDDWEAMQANMTELFGSPGSNSGGQFHGGGGVIPDDGFPDAGDQLPGGDGNLPDDGFPNAGDQFPGVDGNLPEGGFPDAEWQFPDNGGGLTTENPMWVPSTIEFNSLTWTNVGVRYKGNSSLSSGWTSGTLKLPLKLDFDEFEDEYQEIENQRFYGFKQLSLSNSYSDGTYMRDAISADILADAGLPAAETAYYKVILDYGEGPVSLGLYVAIEVIDDTVIPRYFGSDSGNIYEGDGSGVSLAEGTTNSEIENSFLKENNQQDADWSDIETLYTVLHSEQRTSNAEAWRNNMESIFDVDVFLEWLAISAIIQNWDNYGQMSHNFYLYHDPDTDLLTWISWDHNMVLGVNGGGGQGGIGAQRGGMGSNVSLDKDEIGKNWPLIRYLLDDPIYNERYINYINETIEEVFIPDKVKTKIQELSDLINPYINEESSETTFQSAVQELINCIQERYELATAFLDTEE
jgi:hypothetical protein